jgi:hypothetical protein
MIESYQTLAYCRPPPPCGPKVILRPIWEEARDIMKKYNIIEIPRIPTNLNISAPEWKPPVPPGWKPPLPPGLPPVPPGWKPPLPPGWKPPLPPGLPPLPPGLPMPTTVPFYTQSHGNRYTVPLYKLDANILDKITPLYIKIYEIFVHLNYPEYINIFILMNILNIPYSDTNNFINFLNTCGCFNKVSFYDTNVKVKDKKTYEKLWLARLKHYGYPN